MPAGLGTIETRFRYNPDVKSLPGIMPAVISGLLSLILAMLSTLSVVREKELGSILNLYVTPGSQAGFPDRQTTVLHRLRDGQLLLSLRADRVRFRHVAQGWLPAAGLGRAALCDVRLRYLPADVGLRTQPDRSPPSFRPTVFPA